MKFITIGLMLWGGLLRGQTVIAPVVEGGASVPTPPCVTGQVYFNTGAAAGQNLYVCASNTWTQINGASANGANTNTSNTYAAGTVQSFLGTLNASGAAATLPAQTGAALPATCSTGQFYLKTGADPSRMLYTCSATNTWSQAAYAQGTAAQKPATCIPGQIYFATDATAGSNLYFCTGSNTWTQMAGCANCVTGPGSSTDTYVPQWSGASGQVLAAGLPVATLARTIASGTVALGTDLIAPGACASAVTATATGTLTTDVLTASFNGDPSGVTGYIPSTSGMLTIFAYPTAGTANFKVCNNTLSAITPGAITLNWKVAR